MSEEAPLEAVDSGLAPASVGWFVVNVHDAAWLKNDAFGARCAGVETETGSPAEAYAAFPHWQLGRPESWDRVPWT